MEWQLAKLYFQYYWLFAKKVVQAPAERLRTAIHQYTYRSSRDPRNVVILGGSFAGVNLARHLIHRLPSGYRVVLVEPNSHMHYAFAFPRNAVFSGLEHQTQIPYQNLALGAPAGIYHHVQDRASSVNDTHVTLSTEAPIKYDYLVLATGGTQPSPTRLQSTSKDDAIAELRGFQSRINNADRIAVVGGGAAGVQLVTDIRSRYPHKDLTLIHSRQQLLPRFGPKLHSFVASALKQMNISVLLGERPRLPNNAGMTVEKTAITLSTGESRVWDLIIRCTGFRPNTNILTSYAPQSIAQSGEVLVKPTLQIEHCPQDKGNIFAIGDVALTGGPKQGRAAMAQGDVVSKNIVSLIKNRTRLVSYRPSPIEGLLQLTLGKNLGVMYIQDGDYEFLQAIKGPQDGNSHIKEAWEALHAKFPEEDATIA